MACSSVQMLVCVPGTTGLAEPDRHVAWVKSRTGSGQLPPLVPCGHGDAPWPVVCNTITWWARPSPTAGLKWRAASGGACRCCSRCCSCCSCCACCAACCPADSPPAPCRNQQALNGSMVLTKQQHGCLHKQLPIFTAACQAVVMHALWLLKHSQPLPSPALASMTPVGCGNTVRTMWEGLGLGFDPRCVGGGGGGGGIQCTPAQARAPGCVQRALHRWGTRTRTGCPAAPGGPARRLCHAPVLYRGRWGAQLFSLPTTGWAGSRGWLPGACSPSAAERAVHPLPDSYSHALLQGPAR